MISTAVFGLYPNEQIVTTNGFTRLYLNDELIMEAQTSSYDQPVYYVKLDVIGLPSDHQIFSLTHKRLGHTVIKKINETAKILDGIEPIKNSFCNDCAINKKPAPEYKMNPNPATKVLQRVHTDMSGKLKTSLQGNNYYITFIDEFSRKTNIYYLKNKSDALEAFEEYKKWAEKETGEKNINSCI